MPDTLRPRVKTTFKFWTTLSQETRRRVFGVRIRPRNKDARRSSPDFFLFPHLKTPKEAHRFGTVDKINEALERITVTYSIPEILAWIDAGRTNVKTYFYRALSRGNHFRRVFKIHVCMKFGCFYIYHVLKWDKFTYICPLLINGIVKIIKIIFHSILINNNNNINNKINNNHFHKR